MYLNDKYRTAKENESINDQETYLHFRSPKFAERDNPMFV